MVYVYPHALVSARICEVRDGPGIAFVIEKQMAEGAECVVFSEDGEWREVQFIDGTSGWVQSSALVVYAEKRSFYDLENK